MFLNKDYTFKSSDEIIELLKNHDIDLNNEIITYCGIGLSVCVPSFAMKEIIGLKNIKLYSGSIEDYSFKENIL